MENKTVFMAMFIGLLTLIGMIICLFIKINIAIPFVIGNLIMFVYIGIICAVKVNKNENK